MRNKIIMTVLCLAGVSLNIVFNNVVYNVTGLPLYLDTIFTIGLTLLGGLFWGALTGALTNLIGPTISFYGWEGYLFTICNIATAFIVWLFIRFFPRELSLSAGNAAEMQDRSRESRRLAKIMNRMVALILLSFCLCLAMSILGGLIAAFIQAINPSLAGRQGLSGHFSATMFGKNLPVILVEILSRVPVNIIDRLISVFAGYGIALVVTWSGLLKPIWPADSHGN
jgi:hypothetical protein